MRKYFFVLIISFLLILPALAGLNPNDPYYSRQWYLPKIGADSAWTKVREARDITVAVIDSGVDISNPDLKNNIWVNIKEIPGNGIDDDNNGFIDDVNGWDFTNNSSDPSPKFITDATEAGLSHGTMIAGIIGAEGNNSKGVTGVAWKTNIMPLKVLNEKGEGKISAVVKAIDYAVNNGADIINLSFVANSYNEALKGAIIRAHYAGLVVVAAAGNDQIESNGRNLDDSPVFPACLDNGKEDNIVIGVAATDALDQKTNFSGYGFKCVDIAAPGISFFNTIAAGASVSAIDNYYDGYWSGTSMATAVVSGAAALVAQVNPDLNNNDISNLLLGSADNISLLNPQYLGQLGYGRINVNRAVDMARDRLYDHINRVLVTTASASSTIKVTNVNGATFKELAVSDNRFGYNVSSGDVNGDGESEIILAPEKGGEPWVSIYNKDWILLKKFLAYDLNFKGGVRLAVGDMNNDGVNDIVTAPGAGGGPHVKFFNSKGELLKQFFADDIKSRGGLSVAVGDVDNNGQDELIIGAGINRPPYVKIYNNKAKLQSYFLVYPSSYDQGVNVAVTSLYGRKDGHKPSIIVAPAGNYSPLVRIFNNKGLMQNQFKVFNDNWKNGISVAAGDISNDALGEIVVGAKAGGTPHVRIFSGTGELVESFFAFDADFSGGVNVSLLRFNN